MLTLMEMIRNYLMKRLVRKRVGLERWKHEIGPKVFKFVKKVKLESNIRRPEYCGNHKYQVQGYGDEQYVVDIQNKTCACNKWPLIGIPCIHGMSTLLNSNHDPIQFVHNMKQRGRLKKARNLQTDEVRVEGKVQPRRNYIRIKCNECNESWHNKTTCDKRKGTEAIEPSQGT
ncbi:hypothetical protein QYF36_002305 [Acer negundo]|nr:hypothetical protein QYF36_002305 [Acer negundo]